MHPNEPILQTQQWKKIQHTKAKSMVPFTGFSETWEVKQYIVYSLAVHVNSLKERK